MNRQERRLAERTAAKPKPAVTPADGRAFIDDAFRDRISWVAARVLLERVVNEGHSTELDEAIARFLERHPRPAEVGEA